MQMNNLSRRDLLVRMSAASAALACPPARLLAAVPADPEVSKSETDRLITYFHERARDLLRPPMGVLTFPSIAPSLRTAMYSTDLWDWDTLWTARGLFKLSEQTSDLALQRDVALHARGSLQNFFAQQSPEGRIPMLITVHDRDPLGCLRGQRPHKENQAKPVFGQLALLVADRTGEIAWCSEFLPHLERFYQSWRDNNLSDVGLFVWGDDVAIGNDNDPTTFGRPFFSSANLLLNCLYYKDLRATAELARRLGDNERLEKFTRDADSLEAAIQRNCWDKRDHFFYTADVQCKDRRSELLPNIKPGMAMSWHSIPLRIQTFTGFLPMWCGIATAAQNQALLEHLQDRQGLGAEYGVRTLSARESMYSLVASTNPSNWLGPVWIIANYLVWSGLQTNGFHAEARRLAATTLSMLVRDLAESGSLNEYYHPDTGKPLSHKGFMDWNLLALEMI